MYKNHTLDSFGNDTAEVQNLIISELKKVFKWLGVNKLCLNPSSSKFIIFVNFTEKGFEPSI